MKSIERWEYQLGMVAYIYNSNTREAEVGEGLRVLGWPDLHSKTVSVPLPYPKDEETTALRG